MNTVAERYARLGRCYVQLADQFAELDLEHMYLKRKLVELLKALKTAQQQAEILATENTELRQENSAIKAQYEVLQQFEALLDPMLLLELEEAEKAIQLVNETISERTKDEDPDLTPEDKNLASAYMDEVMTHSP
ncbi:hypothetical protein [Candidatus Cyanaurora vandensis]|uniref:hypothetical protein n=1 Tax=Candidatus Cyanaurora vandensis TaxID=2714958 RepID=UPI002579C9BB|nr:hypothetical protein [Candidatus Cyanaurora vandensis]